MDEPVRVLVADDNPAIRRALSELIDEHPGMTLVGTAANDEEVLALIESRPVDVALVDVRMPGGGDRVVRRIRASSSRSRVIVFSAHADRETVVNMFASGAASYLLKGMPPEQVLESIGRVAKGEYVLSPEVTGPVLGELGDQLQRREQEVTDRQAKLDRVRTALRPATNTPVYQPVVDLEGRRRRGVEALSRFRVEPQRTPDRWFAEAWEVGLGIELELAGVVAALPILDHLPPEEFLSVNISPEVVASGRLAELLPPGSHPRLVLELTEHDPVADYEQLDTCLEGMRRAGLRIAIDDAGAGYASLRHILRMSPEIIKLDMSLTRNVNADRPRRALVAALVSFAEETGATVIAEGIETEDELATLRGFGVQWGQGYLLGRPQPVVDATPAMSWSSSVEGREAR